MLKLMEGKKMLLHQQFIKTAKRYGKKLAINDRTTGKQITYEKALIGSLILSNKFKKYDQGFIGIMIPTSAGSALSILGTLLSGRTPVMINYSTGAEQNAKYAQRKCGFKTIITSKALLEKIECAYVDGMVFIEDIMDSVGLSDKLPAAAKAKLPFRVLSKLVHGGSEDDNLVILFTSGSEKDPKAVQLTHRNISSNIDSIAQVFDLSENDVFLASLPYFHVFGQTANLWVPLHYGMTLVTHANPLDFRGICDAVRDEKVTIMTGTPSFFWGYLRKSEPGDFTTVRIAMTGADKCPDSLRTAFLDKHNLTLYEAYGATETSPGISVNSLKFNRPGSVGKALPNVQVKIEDIDSGQVLGIGETGKILVKGDLVMKGYLGDIEETSLRIRNGWYDTGDMGYLDDDGYLWHAGRLKRFAKIGGEMVSLVRVENALESLLPDTMECCVVEVPDPVKGSKILAVVNEQLDEKAMLKKMSASLPNISLPKQFIVINELPKMGSGKIDFRTTTEIAIELITKG